MNVSELGESGLISRISDIVSLNRDNSADSWKNLILGIGDDAAAWNGADTVQMATVDALRQGIHFELETIGWRDLGWKALAVNLSDIAAMGGFPRYALVSIGLPGSTSVDDVLAFYEGMTELARKFDVAIVGGDIDRCSLIEISVTVFGNTKNREQPILRRAGARTGDRIAVTGALGAAAGGFKMLKQHLSFDPETTAALRTAFQRPVPRVAEGRLLVENGVRTAIDVSDGLISDLNHICRASHLGARIDAGKVPVSPHIKANFAGEAMDMALSGGEDYELLFTGSDAVIDRVKSAISCPVSVIGDIVADKREEVTLIGPDGSPVEITTSGWEHFKTN